MKNVLVVAGEVSGQEHALSFLEEFTKINPQTHLWGVGGDGMMAMGLEAIYHLKEFSCWGYSGPLKKAPFYLKAMRRLSTQARLRGPCGAILIDFQTFNLMLAKRLAKLGIPVFYVVAPQAWAWRPWRVGPVKKYTSRLYTILPFEKPWFARRGVSQVTSITHPLLTRYKDQLYGLPRPGPPLGERPIRLLLLPGSRDFEVRQALPFFRKVVGRLRKNFPLSLSLARAPHVNLSFAEGEFETLYTSDQLPQALKEADLALATSGTVALACGLFQLPTVICYQSGLVNQAIFESFVRYRGFYSLTNLVLGEEVYPEFINDDLDVALVARALGKWIEDSGHYGRCVEKLAQLPTALEGECGPLAIELSRRIHA